jgi:hypothetical protein
VGAVSGTPEPADTVRQAADRLYSNVSAIRAELDESPYFRGPGDYAERYRSGVMNGLGGPAGAYAAIWTPGVADALANLLTAVSSTEVHQAGNGMVWIMALRLARALDVQPGREPSR